MFWNLVVQFKGQVEPVPLDLIKSVYSPSTGVYIARCFNRKWGELSETDVDLIIENMPEIVDPRLIEWRSNHKKFASWLRT